MDARKLNGHVKNLERASELASAMKLWLHGNQEVHTFIDEGYWLQIYDAVTKEMSNSDGVIYTCDEGMLGFCSLIGDNLRWIFVESSYRSQGIGHEMLDEIKLIHKHLTARVYLQNSKAIAFFRREGFSISVPELNEETGKYESVMQWSAPEEQGLKIPDDFEQQMTHIESEVGPDVFKRMVADIRKIKETGSIENL